MWRKSGVLVWGKSRVTMACDFPEPTISAPRDVTSPPQTPAAVPGGPRLSQRPYKGPRTRRQITAKPHDNIASIDPSASATIMEQHIPLNYEASAGDTHKQVTTTLPQEVVQCLENARFVRVPAAPALRT